MYGQTAQHVALLLFYLRYKYRHNLFNNNHP